MYFIGIFLEHSPVVIFFVFIQLKGFRMPLSLSYSMKLENLLYHFQFLYQYQPVCVEINEFESKQLIK